MINNLEIFDLHKNEIQLYLDDDNGELANKMLVQSTKVSDISYHKKKTIQPRNGWNLVLFIKFLNYMPYDFTCSKIQNTNFQSFEKRLTIFEKGTPILDIYLKNNLNLFSVKLIRHTPWISYNRGQNYFFVQKQFLLDSFPDIHPYLQFGRYFSRADKPLSPLISLIYHGYFKRRSIRNILTEKKGSQQSVLDVLSMLPGYTYVIKQKLVDDALQIDKEHSLKQLVWIPPWASSRIDITQYLELDASFYATNPYAYCCVNSIVHNESITIALSIGMSECFDLYEEAYCCLEKIGIAKDKLNKLPVLSDMGSALISFCERRAIKQYFCHRHILERFGNKVMRIWCQRLLECTSEEQYHEIIPLIQEEIKIWVSQFKDPSMIPNKINDILCMLDPNTINKKYHFQQWGLWIRINECVGRCSNHSESLHRVFNAKVRGNHHLLSNIFIIAKVIMKRYIVQKNSHGRCIHEKFHDLKNKLLNLKLMNADLSRFSKENCQCGWNKYYTAIFGVRFPCLHEINHEKFSSCPQPPQLIIHEIKIEKKWKSLKQKKQLSLQIIRKKENLR